MEACYIIEFLPSENRMKKSSYSCILFFIIILGSIPNNLNSNSMNNIENDSQFNITPLSQDYQENSTGSYNDIDVSIHQAYRNSLTQSFDQDTTSFNINTPNATNYNVSYSNIEVNNLSVSNHTEILENVNDGTIEVTTDAMATSFYVPTDCFLVNASVNLVKTVAYSGNLNFRIYNSTATGTPHSITTDYIYQDTIAISSSIFNNWLDIDATVFLNNSNTYNNKWFIALRDTGDENFVPNWRYNGDYIPADDNTDSYVYSSGWSLINVGTNVDLHAKVGLSLNKSDISPENVNLTINNHPVFNNLTTPEDNSGFWNQTRFSSEGLNSLSMQINADWYKYSLDVNLIQVNYTKSFFADTSYTVGSEQLVYWDINITLGDFDYRLNNNTINFTIPKSWTPYRVYEDPSYTDTSPVPNFENSTNKFITIFGSDAIDGDWELNCTSTNYITDVQIGIGGVELSKPYSTYSDAVLNLNTSFSQNLDGTLNFSIYNPVASNNELVYSPSEVSVNDIDNSWADWDISNDITNYGEYRVQVRWQNTTDISIYDTTLFIAGATNYTCLNTNNTEILNTASPFNISVKYQDTMTHENISDAQIGFYNGSEWFSEVQTNSDNFNTYNITINPQFYNIGENALTITVNKSLYMNYTFTYTFYLVSDMVIEHGNDDFSVIRGEHALFEIDYSTVVGSIEIDGASIEEVSLNASFGWTPSSEGNGNYTVDIDTAGMHIGEYECIFNITLTDYETLNFQFNVTLTPTTTSITLTSLNNSIVSRPSYQNLSVNLSVEDFILSSPLTGIPESALTVRDISTSFEWTSDEAPSYSIFDLTGGDYLVNISLGSSVARKDVGQYLIRIEIAYSPNYAPSYIYVGFNISGNVTDIGSLGLSESTLTGSGNDFSLFQQDRTVAVNFQYIDLDSGSINIPAVLFDDFTYFVYIDGVESTSDSGTFSYVQARTRNEGDIDFTGYLSGEYNITIDVSFDNYQNASFSFNITIEDLTTAISLSSITQPDHPLSSDPLPADSGRYIAYSNYNLTIESTFTDTINGLDVSGATTREFEYLGNNYTMNDVGDGTYTFILNTSLLVLGFSSFTVHFGLEDYISISDSYNIDVRNLTSSADLSFISQPERNANNLTEVSPEVGYTVYALYNLQLNISYIDTNNSVPISGASGSLYINSVFYGNFDGYNTNDQYIWTIDNGDLTLGTSNITITFFLKDFNPASVSFNITIEDLTTTISLSSITQPDHPLSSDPLPDDSGRYVAYSHYNLTIESTFTDTINGLDVSGATTREFEYLGNNYTMNDVGDGTYTFILNTSLLVLGFGSFTVYFGLEDYISASETYYIDVRNLTSSVDLSFISQPERNAINLTEVSPEAGYTVYAPYNLQLNISYTDTNNSIPISGATGSLYINSIFHGNFDSYNTNDQYIWTIDNGDLILGTSNITITFFLDDFNPAYVSFNITVMNVTTVVNLASSNPQWQPVFGPVGSDGCIAYDLYLNVTYNDTLDAVRGGISGASYIYLSYNSGDYYGTDLGNGYYRFLIDSNDLDLGLLTFSIEIGKEDYNNATKIIQITFNNISTAQKFSNEIWQPDRSNDPCDFQGVESGYTVYNNYYLLINMTYFDNLNETGIMDADIANLNFNGVSYSATNSFNGTYSWNISKSLLLNGNYNLTFFFSKVLYDIAEYSFNITISDLSTLVKIDLVQQTERNLNNIPYLGNYYDVYQQYSVTFNVTYFDEVNAENITDPSLIFLEYLGLNHTFTSRDVDSYVWVISSSDLNSLVMAGQDNITFYFGHDIRTNVSSTKYLNILLLETSYVFSGDIRQPDRRSNPLDLVNPSHGYAVYMQYGLAINASYYNDADLKFILGASANLYINGTLIVSSYYGNDLYGFDIPSSDLVALGLGWVNVTIVFSLANYDDAILQFNCTLYYLATTGDFDGDIRQPDRNLLPLTLVNPTDGYTVFMHYNLVINASYRDEDSRIVSGATANIYINGSLVSSNYYGSNMYGWEISSSSLISFGLGKVNITIVFSLANYDDATIQFNCTLSYLDTNFRLNAIHQPDHTANSLVNIGGSAGYIVYMPFDLVISFEYTDMTNALPIGNANLTDLLFDGKIYRSSSISNGIYEWIIDADDFTADGTYTIVINIGLENYINRTGTINVSFTILPTKSDFNGISQPEQETGLLSLNSANSYIVFSPFGIQFNLTYIDSVTDNTLSGALATCVYNGEQIPLNSSNNGNYGWFISASELIIGTSPIAIQISLSNCETVSYSFNITVIGEYVVIIEKIFMPETMVQGDSYDIIFKLYYQNGSVDYPIVEEDVRLLTNHTEISVLVGETNATGHVVFTFIAPQGDYHDLELIVEYGGELYGVSDQTSPFSTKIVTPTILPSWFLPALLILVGSVSLAIVVQKKVIAPRKMHYTDLVMSSSTIFDDAINLHHIMIIHKATGVSLFFKSFAEEELDPDLISGFLSAVQSFGKEIKSQKSLNELSYGDKILLFSDGVYIRVTLVLGKSASPYMKRNLAKFVGRFESDYQTKLEKWRGQLNIFTDTGDLIDDILNTSVILPHQYNADSKLLKGISRALTKQILDISKTLISEERNFMFLAQLLSIAIDKTKKQPGEIILSITELLDAKILTPIKLDLLHEQTLTDQELRTLRERVWAIPNKSDEEKDQLLGDLQQLSEAERDVAIQSLSQTITITSETTGEVIESKKFETEKDARKELKELDKMAKKALRTNEFDEAIRNYEIAEVIAYQWNLESLGKTYGNLVLSITVTKYKTVVKQKTKDGQKYMKGKEYQSAFDAYKLALEAAHSLFKMGYIEVEDTIKDLVKRSGETLKYCDDSECEKEYYTKDILLQYRKNLLRELKAATKAKDLFMQTEINTKLLLISNILFKFGIGSENSNIKKYHSDIDSILKKMNDLDEEMKNAMDGVRAGFIQSKEVLMQEAISFEKMEDWINALITYQKILDIYCKIGDADNAINLRTKIDMLVQKIPDLHDSITYFSQESDRHRNESKDENMAEICLDNANLLKDAIFYLD